MDMNSPVQILLVEDDPSLPELLAELLRDANIDVRHAASGEDALVMLQDLPIELVLLDLGLPGLDGFELLARIKQTPDIQGIPVIVLTAWNSTKDKLRGFELGATDYLTKPFEAAELRARVQAVLRTKRLADELTQSNRDLATARPSRNMQTKRASGKACSSCRTRRLLAVRLETSTGCPAAAQIVAKRRCSALATWSSSG